MAKRSIVRSVTLLPNALFLIAGIAQADFQIVEDFEGLIPGPIDGQNGWTAADIGSEVVVHPAGGDNQVLSVITESTHLYKEVLLIEGTTRMLFLRFRFGSQLSCSFGMSDVTSPSRFDHFEAELSLTNSTGELRINDGGTYRVLAVVEPDTWYSCWLLIDNASNEIQIWMHARGSQPATAADQLDVEGQTVFAFRNGGTNDLKTFYIKTGGGSGVVGPLLIDEINREDTSALNLSNPGEVSSAVIGGEFTSTLAMAPSQPSPFQTQTAVRFALSEARDIELAVFDIRGRRVANLLSGNLEPRTYEVIWRGRDERGQTVPNGVYFWKLSSGEEILTRKITLTQ